ncbi:MAG: hypothetical protein KIT54_04740 [Phycisphaeraceae bacterium]|nr:hypothetical protein [Phycisphaeraceae bacterium]
MTKPTHTGDPADPQAKNPDPPVVNLLDDKPTKEDLAGGGHKRVADAIARLIEREQGGKAIALEGTWGSGKSSVVQMLDNAFAEFGKKAKESNKKKDPEPQDRTNNREPLPTDYLVYTFDAWKHEGDPLRVAFLRGLVDKLHKEGWLDEKQHGDWATTFAELTSAIRTERTNRRARLRPQDILAITCLLAAVPAITLWVQLQGKFANWTMAWVLANALLPVALLPVAIGFLEYLRVRIFGMPREETEKPRGYLKKILWNARHKQGVVELLLTRQPREHTTTFAGPPTVTTELFEQKYAGLMQEVLSNWPERRLILVIDNLDRLDCEHAMAVWSTMRTFLEMKPKVTAWAGWMWVLVPYDRAQMGRLWDGKATEGGSGPLVHHDRPSSFLDKTFAIRFDVPPLLLANWEKALGEYLKEALGKDLPVEEIESVIRLSRVFASNRGHPPTPRHLKLFVNDIGALVWQYRDKFPVESLAAYTILRRGEMGPEEIREALRVNHNKLAEHIPGDWLTRDRLVHLACLVFNTTDSDAALELLLTGPVTQSIRDGDVEQLEKLLKGPGAVSIIGDWLPFVGDNLKDVSVASVRSCLQLIVKLRYEVDGPNGCSKTRWVSLLEILAERMVDSCENWDKSDDLPMLCREVLAAWPGPKSCERVARRLRGFNLKDAMHTDPEHLAEAWCILWTEGGPDGKHACGTNKIPVPTDTPAAPLFLNHLWVRRETSRGLWPLLQEVVNGSMYSTILPDGTVTNWPESVFNALNVLWNGQCDFIKWEKVIDSMYNYLTSCNGDERDTLLGILAFMRGDNRNPTPSTYVLVTTTNQWHDLFYQPRRNSLDYGVWYRVLDKAIASSNWQLAAAAVAEIGALQDLGGINPVTDNNRKTKKHLEDLQEINNASPLLIKAMSDLPLPAIAEFMRACIARKKSAALLLAIMGKMPPEAVCRCLPATWICEHWSQIAEMESAAIGFSTHLIDAYTYIGDLSLANSLRDLSTKIVSKDRKRFYEAFGEPIREAMLADPKASDVPGIVILAANGSHGFEPGWLPGFLTDPRAPDVVKKAGQADRDSLLATVRENAAKEGDGDGPYTTFLKGCQAAGLIAQDAPGGDAPA